MPKQSRPEKDYSSRSLIDKLGIKPGARVCVDGLADEAFLAQLRERTERVSRRWAECAFDVVVLGAEKPSDLAKLEKYKAAIELSGGIWLVYPKGSASPVSQRHVMEAGLATGLVDNKVVSFSATHTGLRFVFRVADRR
jgi:orotidine-5'-phosphate decarboxylase